MGSKKGISRGSRTEQRGLNHESPCGDGWTWKSIALFTLQWELKSYLQITFSDIPFDIFLSADIENPDLPPSATTRFYKVREDYHIVTVEKMDDYFQPAGIFQLPESARPDIKIL